MPRPRPDREEPGAGDAQALAIRPPSAYGRQLAFLERFPAYGAVVAHGVTWLAYRDGKTVQKLGFLDPGPGRGGRILGDPAVAARVLGAERDLSPLDELMRALPSGHPCRRLHARYRGVRPVLFADWFEGLCWTVLAQQVSVQAAASTRRRLVERHGHLVPGSRHPGLRAFPAAGEVATLTVQDLCSVGVSRQKAAAILRLARIQPTQLAMADFPHLAVDAARERLEALPGIGRWSAEYALVRIFGHPDALPAADVGLRRAWGRLAALGRNATEGEVRAAASALAGWRSHFAFYLWLDDLDQKAAAGTSPPPDPRSQPAP